MKTILSLTLGTVALAALLIGAGCQKHDHHDHGAVEAALPPGTKPYPLKACLVTGEKFDHGKPYSFAHEGQEIQLCCKDCLTDFKNDPAKYLAKLDTKK